jgi:hypothetical protein
MIEFIEILKIAGPALAIGGAWGGAKYALNGQGKRLSKVEDTVAKHTDSLARIETKVDYLVEKR